MIYFLLPLSIWHAAAPVHINWFLIASFQACNIINGLLFWISAKFAREESRMARLHKREYHSESLKSIILGLSLLAIFMNSVLLFCRNRFPLPEGTSVIYNFGKSREVFPDLLTRLPWQIGLCMRRTILGGQLMKRQGERMLQSKARSCRETQLPESWTRQSSYLKAFPTRDLAKGVWDRARSSSRPSYATI